jgi:hypothetical protein
MKEGVMECYFEVPISLYPTIIRVIEHSGVRIVNIEEGKDYFINIRIIGDDEKVVAVSDYVSGA